MNSNNTAPTTNGTAPIQQLQEILGKAVNDLVQLEIMTENFAPDAQSKYWSQINDLIKKCEQMDELSHSLQDVKVPVELIQYIDQGRNPDLFARAFYEQCKQASVGASAKVGVLRQFMQDLETEAETAFPSTTAEYHALASSKPDNAPPAPQ